MFENFWSNFSWVLLLFKGFEVCVLWLPWVTLWEGRSNIDIDDEPSKTFQNSKWSGIFVESSRGELLLTNKVQLLDLASCSWPTLIKLASTNTICNHYDVLVKYLKLHLSSYL
jgi:hypothetical protein